MRVDKRVIHGLMGCILLGSLVGCETNTSPKMTAQSSAVSGPGIGSQRLPIKPVTVRGMRKFPYPYDAMLAISSDADHQTLRKFNMVHAFLNTTTRTPMGIGLGLDFSDSFFMYNGSNLNTSVDYGHVPLSHMMTYEQGITTQQRDARIIDHYIQVGWIDTMHTYGDFSERNQWQTKFRRALAVNAIDTLHHAGVHITVWTDHGNASNVDNFGSYGLRRFFSYQQGANPQSPYHHTDLLIAYGIHFVWGDDWNQQFGHDSLIYPITLQDGRRVWGFWRYTNNGRTTSRQIHWLWSPEDVANQLTLQNLQGIEQNHQYAIIAQHLEGSNHKLPFTPRAISALRLLADQYHSGKVLVARTSRLLAYNVTQQYLRYRVTHENGRAVIDLVSIADPVFGTHVPSLEEVRGVTFYTSDPTNTVIEIGHHPVPEALIQYNKSDGVGKSIGIRWFAPDTQNYVVSH